MKNKRKNKKMDSNNITELSESIEKVDNSPKVPQRSKLKNPLDINKRELNDKQKEFLELSTSKTTKIMFVCGPAGTAKTYMAILAALNLINDRRVSDLIYIRSAVESSDSKLGFLPGESQEKMAPYMQPLMDKLSEFLSKPDIDFLIKEERVSSVPVGFLRGLNWNAKAIICDEAQNMTYKELLTLITRTGEYSKVFILGDTDQTDIGNKSGLSKMMSHFEDQESRDNGIEVFKLTEEDIVRSGLVKFIINKIKKMI